MTEHNGFPILQPEEAAELVANGMTLGIGGFTDPGCPLVVPRALAARGRQLHAKSEPFAVRVLSGAEAGPAVDQDMAGAGAICFRVPYQGEKTSRNAINAGTIEYVDAHLSHVAQQLTQGIYGHIDLAIVEATQVSRNGRVSFSTAIGNAPAFLKLADKVILELNSRHPSFVGDLADIFFLSPRRIVPPSLSITCWIASVSRLSRSTQGRSSAWWRQTKRVRESRRGRRMQ